jgi:hypothetical protein
MDKVISQLKSFDIVNKNEGLQTQSISFRDKDNNLHMMIRNRMTFDTCSLYSNVDGENVNIVIPKIHFDTYWNF